MSRSARWLVGVVALFLLVPVAAACDKALTTRSVNISAVFLDGTTPTALFGWCAPGGVLLIELWDVTSGGRGQEGTPDWQVTAPTDAATGVDRAALLSVPPGWRVGSQHELTTLQPGHEYWLGGTGSPVPDSPTLVDLGVRFTLADLAGLGADEVWAAAPGTDGGQAMTRDAFSRAAADSCAHPAG